MAPRLYQNPPRARDQQRRPPWFLTVEARWTLLPETETPSAATASPPLPTSPTPANSTTPVATPSPVAPLAGHEWDPQPVLVYFDATGGDGCCLHPFPPSLVLYADGTFFTMRWDEKWFLENGHLERVQICELPNTIDQIGFFDYDEASYSIDMTNPPVDGSATWQITANAWRTKTVRLYALGSLVRMHDDLLSGDWPDRPPLPTILPAIRNTYSFLSTYAPTAERYASPQSLALWVEPPLEPFNSSREGPRPWPLAHPRLSDLLVQTEAVGKWDEPGAFLTGSEARAVYSSFDYAIADFGLPFTEAGLTYQVFALPVLPGEMGSPYPPIPPSMACSPSDGLIPFSPAP